MPGRTTRTSTRTQSPGFVVYFIMTIIVVLCLQGIAYLLMMDSTVGPMKFFSKQKPPDEALIKDVKAVVLRSRATAKLWAENPEALYRRAQYWSRQLDSVGVPSREVGDDELAASLGEANLLVLPAAICLNEAQRKAIREFLAAGSNIIASGPVGVRDANCDWVGYDFLRALTGAQGADAITPLSTTYVSFRGDQFYSDRMPPGYLVPVPSQELTLARTGEPDAIWSDWMLRPAEGRSINTAGLALHVIREPGRSPPHPSPPPGTRESPASRPVLRRSSLQGRG